MVSDLNKFLVVLGILAVAQSLDFAVDLDAVYKLYDPKAKAAPFWCLYTFGGVGDFIVAYLITRFIRINNALPYYILVIVYLQVLSINIHIIGLATEIALNFLYWEALAIVNDFYEIVLIGILSAKLIALGVGGNGLYNRRRNSRLRTSTSPSIIYGAGYRSLHDKASYRRKD